MTHESGDSWFEKVLNYHGLDPCIQTIGDEQLQGAILMQLLSGAEWGLSVVSLLTHPRLQFPALYEHCWWADVLVRRSGELVSFTQGEGTGGKRFLNLLPLRSDELQCYSQGKGLRHPGGGKSGTVAEILQLLSWNFPYRKAREMARWCDEMSFLRLWLYLLSG